MNHSYNNEMKGAQEGSLGPQHIILPNTESILDHIGSLKSVCEVKFEPSKSTVFGQEII